MTPKELADALRERADARTQHQFDREVIGGGCRICGRRYPETKGGCQPVSVVKIDPHMAREIADLIDPPVR